MPKSRLALDSILRHRKKAGWRDRTLPAPSLPTHRGRGFWVPHSIETPPRRPRGVVLVTVITVSAICLTLFGLWAREAMRQHRHWQVLQLRPQAVRLAEAGVRRAIARAAADPAYIQETWRLAEGELGPNCAAEVRIRMNPSGDNRVMVIEATAEVPAGAVRRAQVSRRMEVSRSSEGDET